MKIPVGFEKNFDMAKNREEIILIKKNAVKYLLASARNRF